MRNQYYGDSRDVFKWSMILKLVRDHGIRTVLQVAMLRPDDNSGQGNTTHLPNNAVKSVLSFFEEERQVFESDPRKRDIRRITRLPDYCGGGFRIEVFDKIFSGKSYFEEAKEAIRNLHRPALILLDPDTGMGEAKGQRRYKQIREDEIRSIFSQLEPRYVLTLFQYKWRCKNWITYLENKFKGAEGNANTEHTADTDLVLFSAIKGSCRKAGEMKPFSSNHYLRTSPGEELVEDLMMVDRILSGVATNPHDWKWAIMATHSAMQNAMIAVLITIDGFDIAPKKQVEKWFRAYQKGDNRLPPLQTERFLTLYNRVKNPGIMQRHYSIAYVPTTSETDKDIDRLNTIRNDFTHFNLSGWSLQLTGLPRICGAGMKVIQHLVDHSPPKDPSSVDKKRCQKFLKVIMKRINKF